VKVSICSIEGDNAVPLVRLTAINLIVPAIGLCWLGLSPAFAQQTQWQNNWGLQQKASTENMQKLKEQPELPQLPSYSGKTKFVQGCVQTDDKGRSTYQFDLLTKEHPQQVKDWYQNAFNMYKWQMIDASTSSMTADAPNGNSCTIMVHASDTPGYSSQLDITYTVTPSATSGSAVSTKDVPED
jgi:hypothetical protein